MKIKKIILVFLLQAFVLTGPVYSLTIKIGSSAPDRSPWHKALRKMAIEWAKITNNKVNLKIFPFGVAGNQEEMVRKIQKEKLGGAALANFGNIYPDIYALNTPFLMSSEKEFNYVFNKMKTYFVKRIESKGFKVIAFGFLGWYYFFSKNPVFYPEDLQKHKLSLTEMSNEMKQAWKNAGYDIVKTDFKDLEMVMKKGNVNAFCLSPLVAALGQYFTMAPNMSSIKVAPVVGGLVLSGKTWEKIPAEYKKQMMEVAENHYDELYKKIKKLEQEAIEEMEEYDLIVNKLPADALKKWKDSAAKFRDALMGKVFSKDVCDRVYKYLDEYQEKYSHRP
ncbi:MAG: TRAP transporter substrate-binding protein DctP [Candidatus Aminicenantes bacterium]|nr:MAG: TRAP transporter substrate-binding protein DctP [Candidatus Aminicenantes bacterium]